MLQGIRQELPWVYYGLAADPSYVAATARYAINQVSLTQGLLRLQWMLIGLEAAKHAAVNRANWEEADRAESLYKRCRKVEHRVVWRSRDRTQTSLKLGA